MQGNALVPAALFSADCPSFENLEGDCACPTWYPLEAPSAATNGLPCALRQAPTVDSPLNDDYRVLLLASQPSGLAVLNRTAALVWDEFKMPGQERQRIGAAVGLPQDEVDSVIGELWSHGFLVEALALPELLVPKQDSLVVWLHITNACNLRCTYCYVQKTQDSMDSATAKAAISAVFRTARVHHYRRVKIKYTGGEALLNFRRVLETHNMARALAAASHVELDGIVMSNGIGLSPSHVQAMRDGGLRLMISLDGVGRAHDAQRVFANGHGSFSLVQRGIDVAVQHGLVPQISVTVTENNASALAATVAWLLARQLPFTLNYYRACDASATADDLRASEHLLLTGVLAAFKVIEANLPHFSLLNSLVDRANLSVPHNRTCAAGTDYLVIDHKGRVAKCQMEMNIPITSVNESDPLGAIRQSLAGVNNLPVDQKEHCSSCKWKYWCAGGCPLETYRATGQYNLRSPNCQIYQQLYPEVIRLEALRLLKNAPKVM